MSTLGSEYQTALNRLSDRILLARSSDELAMLRDDQQKLHLRMGKLLDKEWADTVPGYQAAIAALVAANQAAKDATVDLDKIADYIAKLGSAITILTKFAASLP